MFYPQRSESLGRIRLVHDSERKFCPNRVGRRRKIFDHQSQTSNRNQETFPAKFRQKSLEYGVSRIPFSEMKEASSSKAILYRMPQIHGVLVF